VSHGRGTRPALPIPHERRSHLCSERFLARSNRSGPDFFFLFFFVLFLAALAERPEVAALGSGLAALGYVLLASRAPVWDTAVLLRIPFLFVTGLMYGYLASNARDARLRAQTAEHALGTMSYDVRAPLAMIVRYSEMLRTVGSQNLTAAQREGIATINLQALEMLQSIVRRLSDVVGAGPGTERPAVHGGNAREGFSGGVMANAVHQ
jgi:signal transduction histidine kinase